MARPKRKGRPPLKSRKGRKTEYDEKRHVTLAKWLTAAGYNKQHIAGIIGVSVETMWRWERKYPVFCKAFEWGASQANSEAAIGLHERACGYERMEIEVREEHDADGNLTGKTVKKTKRFIPPDTAAAIAWLRNRDPEHFADVQKHGGPNGEPLPVVPLTLNIVECLKAYDVVAQSDRGLTSGPRGGSEALPAAGSGEPVP